MTEATIINPDLRDGKLILKLSETASVKRLTPYKKKKTGVAQRQCRVANGDKN